MIEFPPMPFDRMNESDVREEVISPLLRYLGYRTGTDSDIVREQSLRYPRVFLGRKNPGRDPELRGRADYILEVRQRVRWVIEAKAPAVPLTQDDIDQAYTYAAHPEVRAVYFAVTTGLELRVYSVGQGPQTAPLLVVSYSEFAQRFGELEALLSPRSIERAYPASEMSTSLPLAPGLRSIARVESGVIRYTGNEQLSQIQTFITDGSVQRNDGGQVTAYLKTHAPLRELQELNERLGYTGFDLQSTSTVISTDPNRPTIFTAKSAVTIPRGTEILDIKTWTRNLLPIDLSAATEASAIGALDGNVFKGTFKATIRFGPMGPALDFGGDFFLRVI